MCVTVFLLAVARFRSPVCPRFPTRTPRINGFTITSATSGISPRGATVACNSLIKALLVKTPGKRLGCGRAGLLELKRHAWFGGLDWKALIRKEIPAPVVPVLEPRQGHEQLREVRGEGRPGACDCAGDVG